MAKNPATKTTIINLKGIPKDLGLAFKKACKRGKITMTQALKYYMEGVVSLEGGLGNDINALLPMKEEKVPEVEAPKVSEGANTAINTANNEVS